MSLPTEKANESLPFVMGAGINALAVECCLCAMEMAVRRDFMVPASASECARDRVRSQCCCRCCSVNHGQATPLSIVRTNLSRQPPESSASMMGTLRLVSVSNVWCSRLHCFVTPNTICFSVRMRSSSHFSTDYQTHVERTKRKNMRS